VRGLSPSRLGNPMTIEISELDSIQESDRSNYSASKHKLERLCPAALAFVNECVAYITTLGNAFGERSNYQELNTAVSGWLDRLPRAPESHLDVLERPATESDDADLTRARAAYQDAYSIVARSYLLLRLRRDLLLGVSDILKLRVTPALGLIRLQCESSAIMHLMVDSSPLATDWMNTLEPGKGRQFYKLYHSRIVAKLKALTLYEHYELGSSISLHSRVGGVAPGVTAAKNTDEPGTISFAFQEVTNDVDLLFWLALFLKVHAEILSTLPPALPEVDFRTVDRSAFDQAFQAMWEAVGRLYLGRQSRDASK
jgi:hypothetical protein